jgi:hypothetical protein
MENLADRTHARNRRMKGLSFWAPGARGPGSGSSGHRLACYSADDG